MKIALSFLAAMLAASLVLNELAVGDAAGFILIPVAALLALGGTTLLWVRGARRALLWSAILLGTAFHVAGGPLYYRAPVIEGRVSDQETEDPIEGARVIAIWELTNARGERRQWMRVEAITDRGGSFALQGWSARLRPPLYYLESSEPTLEVTKAGYRSLAEQDFPADRLPALSGEQWGEARLFLVR